MPAFRHVAGDRAGPNALGILVPPGRRTLVIVRPRALDWDLLPVDPHAQAELKFWELSGQFAPKLAREVVQALEAGAIQRGSRVEAIAAPDGAGYQVRAGIGDFVLLVCARVPGQAYRPLTFPTVAEACAAAERIGDVLCPAPHAEQEVYFNTQHFARC
jgi:hypothetical protein